MPVVSSDVKYFLSGGASNTLATASLGGIVSTTEIVNNTIGNLFDNVAGGEATSGDVEYRCFYVANKHATDDLDAVKTWIGANTPAAGTTIAVGLDPAGVGDGTATGVAAVIASEQDAPAGVTFSDAANEGTSLAIGAMDAGEYQAIWLRRTVTAGAAAYNGDGVQMTVKGTPL